MAVGVGVLEPFDRSGCRSSLLRLPTAPFGFFFLMWWWSGGASAENFAALQLFGQGSHCCHRPPQAYCTIVFSTRLIYFPMAVLECMDRNCIIHVTAELSTIFLLSSFRCRIHFRCVCRFCMQLVKASVGRLSAVSPYSPLICLSLFFRITPIIFFLIKAKGQLGITELSCIFAFVVAVELGN